MDIQQIQEEVLKILRTLPEDYEDYAEEDNDNEQILADVSDFLEKTWVLSKKTSSLGEVQISFSERGISFEEVEIYRSKNGMFAMLPGSTISWFGEIRIGDIWKEGECDYTNQRRWLMRCSIDYHTGFTKVRMVKQEYFYAEWREIEDVSVKEYLQLIKPNPLARPAKPYKR